MQWDTRLKNVRDVMTELFSMEQAVMIAKNAGLNTNTINLPTNNELRWTNIIENAKLTNKIDAIIDEGLIRFPDNPNLLQLKSKKPAIRGPNIKDSTAWKDTSDEEMLEKIIGGSSQLLPVSFLQKGALTIKSIGRIINPLGEVGTGFIINDNLIVTNNHVLPNEKIAKESYIEFNFQKSESGADLKSEIFYFTPELVFLTSQKDDLTIVKLKGNATKKYGKINVKQVEIKKGERVSIIQHPGGLYKQVALHDNHVVYSGDGVVQYLTDTMPGSSGSPVFNQDWELIAVHHSGGWLIEPNSKRKYFRNEGIEVSKLLNLFDNLDKMKKLERVEFLFFLTLFIG